MKIWWIVCSTYHNGTNYCFHDGYEGEIMIDGIAKFYSDVGSKWTFPWKISNCYEVSQR